VSLWVPFPSAVEVEVELKLAVPDTELACEVAFKMGLSGL